MSKLRANARRADGTPVLRVDAPTYFTLEQAATALATLYADEPLRVAIHSLISGLSTAAETGVLAKNPQPHPKAVDAYRRLLVEIGMFPPPRRRTTLLRELRAAQDASRGSGEKMPPAVQATIKKQPRLWAKVDNADGEPVVRIENARYFDLDQVAAFLAAEDTIGAIRTGSPHMRKVLTEAAVAGGAPSRNPDPEIVEAYRNKLLADGTFPRS